MFRLFLEIMLVVIIGYLFYCILSGTFCHCSSVQCPNSSPLRSYLS